MGLTIQIFSKDYFFSWYAFVGHKRDISNGILKIAPPDILAMGNSQMQSAFDPRVVENNSYNFAYPGTSIIDNYYLLRRYLQNNPAPKTVVYGFFPQNNYLYFYNFWNLHLRYGAYYIQEVWDIYLESLKTGNYLMFEEDYNPITFSLSFWYHYFSFQLNFPAHYQKDLHWSLFQRQVYLTYDQFYQKSVEQKGYYTFYTGPEINNKISQRLLQEQNQRDDKFVIEPILESYLRKYLNLLESHNIKLAYLVMPNHSKLLHAIGEGTAKQSLESYRNIIQSEGVDSYEITSIKVLDSQYLDIQHYNEKGAQEISMHIKNELQRLSLLQDVVTSQ